MCNGTMSLPETIPQSKYGKSPNIRKIWLAITVIPVGLHKINVLITELVAIMLYLSD